MSRKNKTGSKEGDQVMERERGKNMTTREEEEGGEEDQDGKGETAARSRMQVTEEQQ